MRQKYPREEFEYWDSKPTKRRKRKARAADGLYDMAAARRSAGRWLRAFASRLLAAGHRNLAPMGAR